MGNLEDLEKKDFYELLGISRSATPAEIKTAYHEIARIYHPDSHFYGEILEYEFSEKDKKIFQLITSAYDTLIKPDKRKDYDLTLGPETFKPAEEMENYTQSNISDSSSGLSAFNNVGTKGWEAPSSADTYERKKQEKLRNRTSTGSFESLSKQRERHASLNKSMTSVSLDARLRQEATLAARAVKLANEVKAQHSPDKLSPTQMTVAAVLGISLALSLLYFL